MRIALTHAYCWPDVRRGAERILHELGRALASRGHAVTALTSSTSPGRATVAGARQVSVRRLDISDWNHERYFGFRAVPYLSAGRYDVVHSLGPHDAAASVLAARIHPRRRTVYTQLGAPSRSWWDEQPQSEAHRKVVEGIDAYGCMSQWALDILERDWGRTGVLTPGGVNLAELVPADQRADHPVILFSGAVAEPRKGVPTLLAALPEIARREPDVELWLSGPGDPSELLAAAPAEARARTTVLGLGRAEDQAARYGRAWTTALVSNDDSFGMALVESLACGTPILTGDHAAPPELVRPGAGVVARTGDPGSVAEKALEVFELARTAETTECCRAAAAPYDWDTGLAPAFEQIYDGSLAPTGPASGS